MTEVLLVSEEQELPEGTTITNKDGVWIISDDATKLTVFHDQSVSTFSLSSLAAKENTFEVKNIGFLNDNKVFIYAKRQDKLILIVVAREECDPLTILLDTFYFHNSILSVFSPYKGVFCVISREGLSLHNEHCVCLYTHRSVIKRCCYDDEMVIYEDNSRLVVHHLASDGTNYQLLELMPQLMPFPEKISAKFGKSLLLLGEFQGMILLFKIAYKRNQLNTACHPIMCNISSVLDNQTRIKDVKVSFFDENAIIISTKNDTLLLDVNSNVPIVMGCFRIPNVEISSHNSACDGKKLYKFDELYDNAQNENQLLLIAALFRRRNGLSAAMKLLSAELAKVSTIEEMTTLIQTVGVFASSPSAQIRFTRALQFCATTNPHLLLRGMVLYWQLLGSKVIPEAQEPLIDTMCHSECIHAIMNLMMAWKLKFDNHTARLLVEKMDMSVQIEPAIVTDRVHLARLFVEFGRRNEAMNLIAKCILDNVDNKSELLNVANMYAEKYPDQLPPIIENAIAKLSD